MGWLTGRRTTARHSFSASLESKNRGLYFHAAIAYQWTANPDSVLPQPLMPDAVGQHLLSKSASAIAAAYRLPDVRQAEDAINASFSRTLTDDDNRLRVQGRVRLKADKRDLAAARERSREERELRAAQARETVELELLLDRLTDPALGPLWWIKRYADMQFATGDPKSKVESVLAAFAQLRKHLDSAVIDRETDELLRARRRLDEIFIALKDPQTFTLVMQMRERGLPYIGLGTPQSQDVADDPDHRDQNSR